MNVGFLLALLLNFSVTAWTLQTAMELKVEQRTVLKFLVSTGATPINCWKELQFGFGADTPSQKTVRKWYKQFQEGETSTKDLPRTGRPRTARNDDKKGQLVQLLDQDCRQTVRGLAYQLDVGKSSVHNMLKKDLKFSKIAPQFIPKDLNDDQKCQRLHICEQDLERLKNDEHLISKIITGDKSWIAVLELQKKQSSLEWHPKGTVEDRLEKALKQWGERKSMFTIFFDQSRPILSEFKEQNTNVNAESYCGILRHLHERIRRKRPELWRNKDFIIHHDNATPHTATDTVELLEHFNMEVLPHPPYSPNLAPSDYFIFDRIKAEIRGHHHQSIQDMQTAVFRTLRSIPAQEFHDALNILPLRWMKCIWSGGAYFEGHHIVIDPSDFGFEHVSGDEEGEDDETSDQDDRTLLFGQVLLQVIITV